MKLIQMLTGFIHRHSDDKKTLTLLTLKTPVKSLFFVLFTLAAGAQAETLSLVTYYGKTGGIAGDLNTTSDKVNGVSICPNVNTNSNSVPGCDFSDDPGYQKNNINDPTDDTYSGDLIVRNNDQFEVVAGWSVTGGNEPVTITAILPDNSLRWDDLSSSCKAGSSISADGLTMVCIRSGYTAATAYSEDIPFNVKVNGSAQNGHIPGDVNITVNSDNATAKQDAAGASIITTASPRWNLQQSIYTYNSGQTHNGVAGMTMEYKYYLEVNEVANATDTASGILGNESLGNDFTLEFNSILTSVSPNAELVECRKDHSSGHDPYAYFNSNYPHQSIATPDNTMVQTCSQAGGVGTPVHVTHTHIDATLNHVPTASRYNAPISVTRAIAAIGTIIIFIPNTDIFAGINDTDTTGANELLTTNHFTDFNPISISGQSNFGADTESENDNNYVRTLYGTGGSFSKHYTNNLIYWPTSNAGGGTGYRAGNGVVTPGSNWTSRVNYYSSGSVKLTGGIVCDIFDSNTVDVTDTPNNPDHAIEVHYNTGGSDAETGAVYEYATGYVSGSWPPNPDSSHADLVAQECGDPNITWHPTTTAARAVGPITKIRVRFTQGVPAGRNTYTIINLTARSNKQNGDPIPAGTIIANYASVTDDNYFNATRYPATNGWYPSSYQPKSSYDVPHSGSPGDRILLVRGKVRVAKDIAQANASTGETLDATLTPTFTCDGTTVESSAVKITEMMDPGLSYVAGSSSVSPGEPTIGSCADLEAGDLKTVCTAQHTILIWDLGTKSCNTSIPAISFNTLVDANAPVGTLHTYSIIQAATDASLIGIRTANQNINIAIPSALILTKTTVDSYFDAGDTLSYTIHSRNGTTNPLSNLDMIDILPFNGDGTDGMNFTVGTSITHQTRSPASDFEGAINFTQATTGASCTGTIAYRYTNKIPKNIDISPTADSNKPAGNTTWCDGTATGPNGACGFTNADVTAIRVTGADLGPTAICSITITAQAPGHALDKFQQFSNTAGAYAQGVSLPTLSNVLSIAGQPPVTTPDNKANPNAIAADNPTSQDVTLNDTHPVASVGINKSTINFIGGTDTDSDGDADQIIIANEGTWTVDANGIVTFTPLAGFTGTPAAVQYNVKANNGFISNTSAVTVSYTSPPVANNDSQANPAPVAPTNPTMLTAMTDNDSDTDGTIDPATVDLDPATDGIQSSFTNADGTWISDGAGNVTFTPNATLATSPQPIDYTVNNNVGNTSNIATLTITYGTAPSATSNEARNNTPVAADNPTVLTNITDNDSDPDGTIDTATIDLDPSTDGIQTTFTNTDGTWEVTNTTDVTFTPNANLQDNPTPITYVVNDNDGNPTNTATLTIIYGKAPIAVDDKKHNPAPVSETNPTILSLIAGNDSDPDPQGSINVSSIDLDPATAGIQTTFSNAQGNWAVDALGNVTFTPDATLTTDPTPIDYTVNDNEGNTSNIAKLTVTYGTAPVAVNDIKHNPAPVSETNPTTLPTIASNDTDSDGTIDASTIDLDPATAGKQSTFTNDDGTWTVTPEGNVTFTPNATLATDPAVIPYTVEDNEGNTSNTATLTVTYGEAPVAVADSKHNPAPAAPENPTTLTAMTGNDSDPDGTIDPATVDLDPATAGIQNSLANDDGTWTVTTEGNVTFTPNATLSGNPQVINYTVNDNEGNTTNTATLTITYGSAPVAVNDIQHNPAPVAESNPTTLSAMTGNDSDADGTIDPATVDLDPATAGIQSTFSNDDGTWTTTPEGNVTFTPKATLTTDPAPINYVVSDNEGVVSNIATLTVTYGSAPVAVDDSKHNTAPVAADNPTTLTAMTGNDTDSDGTIDPATVDLDPATTGVQNSLTNADGVWTVTATGDVTFTPAASLTGNPTAIPYTVKDNEGNISNTATLTVTYGSAPVAVDDSKHNTAPVAHTNPTTLTVMTSNDTDADGTIDPATVDLDPATAGIQSSLTNSDGIWTVTPTGDVTFTPAETLTGNPAAIPYTVNDNEGNTSNTATLTVTYGLAPIATNDSKHNTAPISQSNPTTLKLVTANDSDEDGTINPATVDLDPATAGIQNSLTNADGEWTVTPNGNVTFAPNSVVTENPAVINYTVQDNEGNTTNIATLTVTYGEAPLAINDSQANTGVISPQNPTTLTAMTGNDSDTDGNIDPATVDLDPATAGIQNSFSNGDGVWTVDATGNVTFTPSATANSDPAPINYTVNDNEGNTSNIATLTVTYGTAPTAVKDSKHNPAPVSATNPTTLSVITGNDSDTDGTLDLATIDLNPSTAGIQTELSNSDGTWSVNAAGDVTFTPNATLTGNPAPIPYTVNDNHGNTSNTALLTVTYGLAPVATSNSARSTAPVAADNPVTLEDITGNDSDPDGTIDPTTVDLDPTKEGIQKTFTNGDGTWTVTNMGDATFTPNAQLNHDPAPIDYVVSDNEGNLTNIAQLEVIYGLLPLAVDDVQHNTAPVAADNPTTLSLMTANDSDTDGEINPATVDLDPATAGVQSTFSNTDGEWSADTAGNVTFTPNASLTANPAPINYTVNDNEGNTSNIATLTVTYGSAPVAVKDSAHNPNPVATSNPTLISVVTTNDSDEDGTIDPTTVDLDPSSEGIQNTLTNADGTWTVSAAGDVTFTPNESLTSDPQPIPYTVNDNDGNTSNTALLTVSYGLAPVAQNDSSLDNTTTEAVTINPLSNDNDPDGTLDPATVIFTDEGASADGKTLTVEGEGVWTINPATGEITFTPAEGFTANPTPVTYTVNDNDGNTSNVATVTITYVARPPVANDDSKHNTGVVAETNPTTLALVTTNDNDPDGVINPASVDLDPSSEGIQNVLTNADGTWAVTPEGTVTFTPNAELSENPQPITYTVNDNDGNTSNAATLTVTYGLAPVAENDSSEGHTTTEAVTINPLTNDSDPDGTLDPTTVVITTEGVNANGKTLTVEGEGVWTVNPETGEITFTPEDGFTANPTPISYTVKDNDGNVSNVATVTITYVARAPIAVNDTASNPHVVAADNPTTLPLMTGNDSDPDGAINPASVDLDPSVEGFQSTLTNDDGTWTVTPEGNVTFTPNAALSENPQPIPYTVNDNDGNTSNTATLTISYGAAPVAVNDSKLDNVTTEPVTVETLSNDSDPDGELDPTTVVITSAGVSEDGKTLTVEGEGVWTVNPETGAITFTPEEGFTANPTPITYTVKDNDGNLSNVATVTITYTARPPVAVDDSKHNPDVVATTNPTTLELIAANDSDPDGVLDLATLDLDPSSEGIQQSFDNADGNWNVTPEGTVTFTPNASLSENPQPIPYTVNDNDGNTSNTATLTVTYGHAPIATDNEKLDQIAGTTVTLAVATDDSDPDDDLDPTSVKLIDANGNPVTTLVIEGQGTWTVNPESGDISFAPEPGYTDDPTPVSYEISDLTGKVSNQATVTVTYSVTASIIGTVWLDRNKNGEIDPNERRMPNWTLKIRDTEGNVIRTTTTDAQGNYSVEGLAPEEYTIEFYNERGVMIASRGTNGPLQPTLPNARPYELLLPIDPSGVVYNSTTRQPVEGVQLQLQNSLSIAVNPICLGPLQQNQITGVDGLYAFDVNAGAHATCPANETYHIRIVRVPHNYHAGSELIPADTGVYQGAPTEAGCTVDAIANSGSCEVQAQADAPTGNQSTRYFFGFELQTGDLNIIFNHIAIDEVTGGDILVRKTVNKQQGSIGDMFFYTIDATNTTSFSNRDIDLTDNIPAGFTLVSGSSKLIRAGADGKLGTKDDVRVNVTPIGTDPMTYNNIDFAGNEKLRITYMMRVGATAIEGKHVNTVQALNTLGAPASNISKVTVNIIAEATIDQSTLIGKVFHDRDGDGYQDAANITGISIKGNGYTKYAGGLTARVSTQDNPAKHSKVINVPWNNAGDNSFTVETQQGTRIQVDNAGNITEMHRGMKAKGLTGQQLQVNLRRAGDELEITLTNLGINEEGIPGVRLATVKGLVLETDGYGRYHIPDVDGGRRGFGKNFIIKVDKATLPKGSTFTTENPRVLRITGAALNKINFGVLLPGQQAAAKGQYVPAQYKTVTRTRQVTQQRAKPQTVAVNLGSIFFDKDKHYIRPDQRGTMDDIATKIQQYGHGHITIDAFTDARHNAKYNIALAERRANTVRKELQQRLGSRLMRNVRVDVDKSAYKEVPHNDPRAIDYNKAREESFFDALGNE